MNTVVKPLLLLSATCVIPCLLACSSDTRATSSGQPSSGSSGISSSPGGAGAGTVGNPGTGGVAAGGAPNSAQAGGSSGVPGASGNAAMAGGGGTTDGSSGAGTAGGGGGASPVPGGGSGNGGGAGAGGAAAVGGPFPWPAANEILANTAQPVFPNANFPVTDYDAKGDGTTDNTAAFQRAIQACAQAGGGHVIVPSGTFVVGAIALLSNVDLHLAATTTILKFSADVSKYPRVLTRFRGTELMNHSPMVYAYGQHDIGLTGSGVLDAADTAAWQKDTGKGVSVVTAWGQNGTPVAQRLLTGGDNLRVTYVEPYNSQKVLIQGVTLKNAQFWNIHPTLSQNVTVDGVTISATAEETDGCDPESSDHVVIQNVNFKTGDDDIAIKSGRDNDGRRLHTPTTNIVIRHVTFDGNYGILALGSEESGGIAHIFGYDMTAVDNHTRGVGRVFQYGLFMKANWDRGGVVQDIHLDTVTMSNLSGAIVYGDMTYNGITSGQFPPTFGDIHLSHITISGAQQVFDVFATPSHPFGAITLDSCTFTNVSKTTNTLTDVQPAPVLTNVTVNGKAVN